MTYHEELIVLRDLIDFVNRQVGVYSDACAGFEENRVRVERQIHRIARRSAIESGDGAQTMVFTSFEDSRQPDVIHHRLVRASDFMSANSPSGFNHQQIVWAIIVFLFSYWEDKARQELANARCVKVKDIVVDVFGDLRILRRHIVHNKGILPSSEHRRLKILPEIVQADAVIDLSSDQMHLLFVAIKRAVGSLILEKTGHLPGAPTAASLSGIAIQINRRT